MDFDSPAIQIGSLVEINFPNDDPVGVFKIIDIKYQPNNILIYLTSNNNQITRNNPNRDIILNLSNQGNIILGLPFNNLDGNELSVTFLGPGQLDEDDTEVFNEDLLDGLQVYNEDDFIRIREMFIDYLRVASQNENRLNLDSLRIYKLPRKYFSHPKIINNLQELFLSQNGLISLPEEIGNLYNLQYLGIWGNYLTDLPKEIGNLQNLLKLNVSENELTSIPEKIGNLRSLQELNLRRNELTSIPNEIGNLENLEFLDLGVNKLMSLPEEIGNLSSLRYLGLDHNLLTSLPSEIGNLQNLTYLNLGYNKITYLPIEIGNLEDLLDLNLTNNPLEGGIPKTIEELRQKWKRYKESSINIKSARKR